MSEWMGYYYKKGRQGSLHTSYGHLSSSLFPSRSLFLSPQRHVIHIHNITHKWLHALIQYIKSSKAKKRVGKKETILLLPVCHCHSLIDSYLRSSLPTQSIYPHVWYLYTWLSVCLLLSLFLSCFKCTYFILIIRSRKPTTTWTCNTHLI